MSWTSERARVASLSRSRTADDPELLAAKAALRRERERVRLEEHVRVVVDGAPELSPEQRARLAALLNAPAA